MFCRTLHIRTVATIVMALCKYCDRIHDAIRIVINGPIISYISTPYTWSVVFFIKF